MQWSKLKQLIELRFVEEMKGRALIQVTRYRKAHDDEGEIWLTLDGKKIYGASYYQKAKERRLALPADNGAVSADDREATDRQLAERGFEDQYVLQRALFLSLSESIEQMLASHHPLIRALAVLDRRCGERRLAKLAVDIESEHEVVRRAHALRRPGRQKAPGQSGADTVSSTPVTIDSPSP